MLLTDYHVHSDVSMDCHAPMWEMIRAEADAGVAVMCFTNHCDLVRMDDFSPAERCLEIIPESAEKLAAAAAEHDFPIEVRLGVELAEAQLAPEKAAALAADPSLDFVLGSMHLIPGVGDYYFQHYTDETQCAGLFTGYMAQLQRIAELDFYDVLAHLGYVRRYMWRDGVDFALTLDRYGDQVEQLLRTVIDKGKGLELNCSGIRDGCGPFPSEEILRLYRSMGGEIVTVGSDAHRPAAAAAAVREGHALLKACGFDYVSIFRHRQPEFIRLSSQS